MTFRTKGMRGMAPAIPIRTLLFLLCIPLCYCNEWYNWESFRYFVSSGHSLNYSQAVNACVSTHRAQLTSISSLDEKNFLIQHLSTSTADYWIGIWINQSNSCSDCSSVSSSGNVPMSCTECRRKWTWLDATPMSEDLLQSAWKYNEPTGGQNCARLTYQSGNRFEFADDGCGTDYNFICKQAGNVCTSSPCRNGGSCEVRQQGYTCLCSSNYTGTNCETVDYCHDNPCRNGGSCSSRSDRFECSCMAGFTGDNCETVDYCHDNPCRNGGSCSSRSDRFECSCMAGFTGDNCETVIDACSSNPCQNGGQCQEVDEGFLCMCRQSFTGKLCQSEVASDTPSPTKEKKKEHPANKPLLIALIVGSILAAITVVTAVVLVAKYNRQKKRKNAEESERPRVSVELENRLSTLPRDNKPVLPVSPNNAIATNDVKIKPPVTKQSETTPPSTSASPEPLYSVSAKVRKPQLPLDAAAMAVKPSILHHRDVCVYTKALKQNLQKQQTL